METKKTTLLKWALLYVLTLCVCSYSFSQAPVADFAANTTIICYWDTTCVNFTDMSTNNPTSWEWTFQGGSPSSSTVENPISICYYNPGTFDVTLIATNIFGSDTITKTAYINILPPFVINLGNNFLTLQPDTVVLDAGPGFVSYLWSDASNGQTLSINSYGSYCVTVTDINGCTETDCINIGEMPSQPPIANFNCLCFMDTVGITLVSFTDQSLNLPSSWNWDFGDGNMSSVQHPLNWYIGQGYFTVSLTVSNIIGSSTSYGHVLINPSGGCSCYSFSEGNASGRVFSDLNADCVKDSNEYVIQNRLVQAVPGPYYAITNHEGLYSFMLDNGTYTISLVPQNTLWYQNCPASPDNYNVNISSPDDTVSNLNFGLEADIYCPDLSVNISTWAVRPCFASNYYVSWCNNGTVQADNATIEVELSQYMTYISGTGSLISQNGNILTFGLGNVVPGQCGSFNLYVDIVCDIMLVGQTMCIQAHIYPDTLCTAPDPAWDRSSVAVEGACVGDSSACFKIYNTGDPGNGDMDGQSEYRIFENNFLVYTGYFQIVGGDSLTVCWPANGNTIRLEADQRPGHPGNSHPQDNVEMCGGPSQTLGQITLTPDDDDDDFVDINCNVVIASYDPNDKSVQPVGLTPEYHYIDSTYVLEYTIRFQNTGTDTAFNIVVRDTISLYLDITTLEPGVSSHAYILNIFENNILQWKFENILLPDSTVNEPASHGFVKYKIHQKPGNTLGTVIENKAGIIFDFNVPVITNTVFNIVGSIDSVVSSKHIIYNNGISVINYPNPFNSSTTFELKGIDEPFIFELYNITGIRVKMISDIKDNKFVIARNGLPDGIYIYKISSKYGLMSTGKLIVN